MAEAVVQHRIGPETARLHMRAFEPDDAEVFHLLASHPEVIRYTGEQPLSSVAVCRQLIADYPDFRIYGFGRWACVLKSTGAVIGMAGLKFLPEWQVVDLGYRFVPEHWGKGLATEAGRACLQFAFEVLKLQEVHGFVDPRHAASRRVLEKLAMRSMADVLYDGEPTVQYAVTAEQYALAKA